MVYFVFAIYYTLNTKILKCTMIVSEVKIVMNVYITVHANFKHMVGKDYHFSLYLHDKCIVQARTQTIQTF